RDWSSDVCSSDLKYFRHKKAGQTPLCAYPTSNRFTYIFMLVSRQEETRFQLVSFKPKSSSIFLIISSLVTSSFIAFSSSKPIKSLGVNQDLISISPKSVNSLDSCLFKVSSKDKS